MLLLQPSRMTITCARIDSATHTCGWLLASRYHCVAVPLTLDALARVAGQLLLTLLPDSFIAVASQQLLSPAQAAGLSLAEGGGVISLQMKGQLNRAPIILGNIQVQA